MGSYIGQNALTTVSPHADRVKPFRLVKVFTFTSLILMFVGTIVLSGLNAYWVQTMLIKKSEDYAALLVENLNHQIFLQFVVPVAMKYGKIQLRNKEQFKWMDKVVKSTLHGFKVEHVNIYDRQNTISYSFDSKQIGKKNIGGTGYQHAVDGESSSTLVQRGNFLEVLIGFPEESRLITFAPLHAEQPLSAIEGPVLGVVEIIQDLTDDHKKIFRLQVRILQTCFVVMVFLFLILRFVVKRGEGIIQRRSIERIRLQEELDRAKHLSSLGEMTAGISHEIRNPLGIIRSSAELLSKKMKQTDPDNSVPDIIIEESSRLDDIISDFLNFARPKTPNFRSCRVEKIIEKNLTFLAMHIKENGYHIDKHYSDDLPEIKADSDMLYQAFLNILINSIQAMPKGGRLSIKAFVDEQSIVLKFEDEGKTITQDELEKIWDPFFTTKEKGTGLGLGIVKNIIEAHNGSISLDNRSSRGVCVTIKLPVI